MKQDVYPDTALDNDIPFSIFKLDFVRGVVGQTLRSSTAYLIGRAFGTLVRREHGSSICVARDGRHTSIKLEEKLVEGLMKCGLHVIRLHTGPRSFLLWAEAFLSADASIMVAGGNGPVEENGFFFSLRQRSLAGRKMERLCRLIEASDFTQGEGTGESISLIPAYTKAMLSTLLWGKYAYTVAWDPGGGTVCPVLKTLLKHIPGEHALVHGGIDSDLLSRPLDPTVSEHLQSLQSLITRRGCDLGFAFDGEGNTLTLVDGSGHLWSGDELFIFFAQNALAHTPRSRFIMDKRSNPNLINHLFSFKGNVILEEPLCGAMKEALENYNAQAAGSCTGEFILRERDTLWTGGIYAALKILSLLSFSGISLKEWYATLPSRLIHYEKKAPYEGAQRFALITDLKNRLKKDNVPFSDLNGICVRSAQGFWSLEPVVAEESLLLICNAQCVGNLQFIKDQMQGYLEAYGIKLD